MLYLEYVLNLKRGEIGLESHELWHLKRLGSEPMMGVTLAQELARESLLSIIQVGIREGLCSQE